MLTIIALLALTPAAQADTTDCEETSSVAELNDSTSEQMAAHARLGEIDGVRQVAATARELTCTVGLTGADACDFWMLQTYAYSTGEDNVPAEGWNALRSARGACPAPEWPSWVSEIGSTLPETATWEAMFAHTTNQGAVRHEGSEFNGVHGGLRIVGVPYLHEVDGFVALLDADDQFGAPAVALSP